jgi:hypothetical protein
MTKTTNEQIPIWADPSGDGWVDAWNGWYSDLAMAMRDGSNGVGRPWLLSYGEGIIDEAEQERRWEVLDTNSRLV